MLHVFSSEFKICIIRIYNIGKFAIKNDRENMTLKKGRFNVGL